MNAMDEKECFALIREHAFLLFFKNINFRGYYVAHTASHLDIMIASQSRKNCSMFFNEKLLENALLLYFFTRPPVKMPRKLGATASASVSTLAWHDDVGVGGSAETEADTGTAR
jgi:hypothetical protein